jgi:uncharacterized protein (DUF433 family)
MPLDIQAEAPPLRMDDAGAIRVGKTRVLFVLVVRAFKTGETPERIVEAYDVLSLADVYGAIAYYLRHQEEVEAYLRQYDRAAEEIRRKIEERQGPQTGVRERLLRRLAEKRAVADSTPSQSPPADPAPRA